MHREEAMTPTPVIIAPGEGRAINAFGNTTLFKITKEFGKGEISLALATVPAGSAPPPHRHLLDDEVFIIIDGRYSIFDGNHWTDVEPGSVVYLPRGSVHTFRNGGDTVGHHWVLTTPGGVEEFFAKCEVVFAAPGPPDRARLGKAAEEHGLQFIQDLAR
jgi:mannose-6-phosphate isomerase-like protein (cupin superfamily)